LQTQTYTKCTRPFIEKLNFYICLHLLTLRIVKLKPHAGMQLLLSIKTNTGHKCRLSLNNYFDFISSAVFLVQTVFIFNFAWVCEISSSSQLSVVHIHKFFVLLVLRFHVSKAHSLFRYNFHQNSAYVFTFKNHRSLFSDST